MSESEALSEAFARVPDLVHRVVNGLTAEQLSWAPSRDANTIGWLIWHLTRIQDDHIADLIGDEQIWTSGDWAAGVGLAPDPANNGYGHDPGDVAAVRASSPGALTGYFDAVYARTSGFIARLNASDLTKIVDDSWDPPVTMRVRLVSVLSDDLQHVGQAAYLRGLLPEV